VKEYKIPKFQKTNQNTTIDLRPIVKKGDKVVEKDKFLPKVMRPKMENWPLEKT
jgi:DNA-directed RNA polymerase beta subunit